jgi:hypothetical protein
MEPDYNEWASGGRDRLDGPQGLPGFIGKMAWFGAALIGLMVLALVIGDIQVRGQEAVKDLFCTAGAAGVFLLGGAMIIAMYWGGNPYDY